MHAARVKFANRSGTKGKRSVREPPIKVFSALRWDGIADCEMLEMGCLGMRDGLSRGRLAGRSRVSVPVRVREPLRGGGFALSEVFF